MSLILEALKKSEQDRRRERIPDIRSIHQPVAATVTKRRRARWLVPVILINLNALALWWWLDQRAPFERQHAVEPVAMSSEINRMAAATTVTAANDTAPAQAPLELPATASAKATAAFAESDIRAAPLPIQELAQLPAAVREQLPAMTFSFHVYSANPARRSIIINERRLQEGDAVSSSVDLAEITRDGVILAKERYRIHIPVMAGW